MLKTEEKNVVCHMKCNVRSGMRRIGDTPYSILLGQMGLEAFLMLNNCRMYLRYQEQGKTGYEGAKEPHTVHIVTNGKEELILYCPYAVPC